MNMKLPTITVGLALCLLASAHTVTEQQQPLDAGEKFDLIAKLKQAEIIPTVLDPFQPFLSVNISWKKASADIGNTIKPKKVQHIPDVYLFDELPGLASLKDQDGNLPQLTLVLTDPDAKSRDNPIWSEMCHWIATDVPLVSNGSAMSAKDLKEIMPYKPPGPPPKTGKHRYVFAALAPKNGTHETLHLTRPKDRQHWGYGEVRRGLRSWAEENGLVVVGANFFYAQSKKQ